MDRQCCKCDASENETEIVCTDYGFYCWGCFENILEACQKCWEVKEQKKECENCGHENKRH